MRFLHFATKFTIALCLATTQCLAQSQAVVKHNANLRQDPSTDQRPIRKLLPPETMTLVEPDPTNGYYHVQTGQAEDGWIYGKNIEIQSASALTPTPTRVPSPTPASTATPAPILGTAANSMDANWEKPDPQDSVFHGDEGDCGETGDGGDSATNARKNRMDVPSSYHLVTWDTVNTQAVPQGAPKSRAKWTQAQLGVITPFRPFGKFIR